MIATITKRDGRQVPFTLQKISAAIVKSFQDTEHAGDEMLASQLALEVARRLDKDPAVSAPGVEMIQDTVEQTLIDNGLGQIAKKYILYRAERSRIREMNTRLMKVYEDITFSKAEDSDLKRENANINADSAMGMMLKYGTEGAKEFYDMFMLKPEISQAHKDGDIHIHDFDFYGLTTTCCQIDILKLFHNGFSTGHGVLREPNSIASYAALACIAIQANQNDQHGGQSIVNFDYGLAPGIRKTYVKNYRDNLAKALMLLADMEDAPQRVSELLRDIRTASGLIPTLQGDETFTRALRERLAQLGLAEEVMDKALQFTLQRAWKETDHHAYQAMEALIHNLNTMHSRAGAQTPFSSINYGMDTSAEGRMVIKNVLLATEAGLGHGETPIFPIQIFRVKEGINYNPGDPSYDLFQLACRVSAKRLFPNFSFQDAPFNLRYYKPGHPETEIAYMGCRTRVIGNVYDPNQEISNGRGNLSFTSINLPRIAINAQGNVDAFFAELDQKIDLVVDQLLERLEVQSRKRVYNYPFLMGQGVWLDSEKLDRNAEVREVLKHGTLSVGFIGLAECLKALTGKHHGESTESQELGLKIIRHMRARVDALSQETRLNFTLLATPAEGLSGTFIRKDKKKYGIIPGVTDRDYYTNSFHVPVYYSIGAYDKIALEAPYHELTNAGHITYVELDGDPSQNLKAFEKVVRAMHDLGVGYGSINHPVDRDPVCGYNGIIGDNCPQCGREEGDQRFERIRRITGYLVGTLDSFNNAKRAEERDRVKHNV